MFDDETLERHAVSLADSHIAVRKATPVVSLLERIEQNQHVLARCYESLLADAAADRPITPAARWLVDNFHSLEENAWQARHDLPSGYFTQLPKLGPGFLDGHPRIFAIMWAYVAHTDSNLNPEQLARYVRAYDGRKSLTLGELWAIPINLRILLVENARRLAESMVVSARERREADAVANDLLGIGGAAPKPLDTVVRSDFHPSRAYAVQLLRRLAEQPAEAALGWVRAELARQGHDPQDAIRDELQNQTRATLTMRNIIVSLRLLSDLDWEEWVESVSAVEAELRTNAGYAALDLPTRNLYRYRIELLARGGGQDEINVTRALLTMAGAAGDDVGRDPGYWLIDAGREGFEHAVGYRTSVRERLPRVIRRAGLPGYLGAVALATAALTALGVWFITWLAGGLPTGWIVLVVFLAILPVSDFVLSRFNYRITRILPATFLPALALKDGVTEDLRTLVAIPTMLTSLDGVAELIGDLEVHFLANDNGETYFAAVTDWTDSQTENREDDLPVVEAAVAGVRELNARYGDRFFLFHRHRRYNPAEGVWMGWERKRGKLEELNQLLRGANDTSISTVEGRLPGPIRFVITLDSDTRLPRAAAQQLVAKLAHPLNQARFDDRTGRIYRGYSILAPRVTPSLPPREETSFYQKVYSTQPGLDPYAFTVSDVYQDLFDEGSFAGKGIYDLDSLTRALGDHIPENSVLSHDLLEGNYTRSGLVTDVEVLEEHPTSYEVGASRVHRWTRGDWQLLPWIVARHDGLSGLGLWKMADNLRRSLSPILQVTGLLVALALLPVPAALAWLLLLVASYVVPQVLYLVPGLLLGRPDVTKRSQASGLAVDFGHAISVASLNFTFLAHQAAIMVDAICRTLWRMVVTHRNLLEWTTAAAAEQQAKGTLTRFVSVMAGGLVAPFAALLIAVLRGPEMLAVAAFPVVVWLLAPVIAQRVSRHYEPVGVEATTDDLDFLEVIARRTWAFFETFVNADENHLPPDNFQEDPAPVVAHRTSTTNIGLYYLATVGARDFGWIGLADAAERLEATTRTMVRLEHYQGHLYNWYDTRTLEPLPPRYVSSVDNGNLAGHLIALANACREWQADPGLDVDRSRGIAHGVALIRQSLETVSPTPNAAVSSGTPAELSAVDDRLAEVDRAIGALAMAQDRSTGLAGVDAALVGLRAEAPDSPEVQFWIDQTRRSVASQQRDAALTPTDLRAIGDRLTWVEDQARREFDAMDFRLVLDRRRQLLSVGYNPGLRKLDKSVYDLLGSECRLGSFVAIAKGDIRTRHWFRLGRPMTAAAGGTALLSWSGSMFEYLMPLLVMHAPAAGLLRTTYDHVVQRHIDYGNSRGVPWGISESGYYARDSEFTYQYSPFGVPGLGAVRGLADNLVIAPYATGLAAMIRPAASAANYRRLAAIGARGRYGYYEAVDYTGARLQDDEEFGIVRSFMAHHQAMTILAIHNVIHDGLMRQRFHVEPIVKAAELLLHERAPRGVPIKHAQVEKPRPAEAVHEVVPPAERTFAGPAAIGPALHLMSNGTLSLRLTPAGGGQLIWKGLAITRWRPDRTTGDTGEYLYLRDHGDGHLWSAAAEPVGHVPDSYDVRFAEDRARYSRRDGSVETVVEHHLSPESDAVVRKLTVSNVGRRQRRITLTSYAEPVLAPAGQDDAHPAFSKLFVHTEYLPDSRALLATRRSRSGDDPQVWVAHFVTTDPDDLGEPVADTLHETDRLAFIGRNRSTRSPARLVDGVGESGRVGDVLDPILSLSQQIEVPPGEQASVCFWTVVAGTRDEVVRLVAQHRAPEAYERLTMLAWTQSQVQLRHLGMSQEEAGQVQDLAGHVLFPHRSLSALEAPPPNAGPRSALWPLGISGDLPLLVVRIDDTADLGLVPQVVRAFRSWRLKRFAVDIVLLNERSQPDGVELQHTLTTLAGDLSGPTDGPGPAGRIVVVRRDEADPDAVATVIGAAAVVLQARQGGLREQLARARALAVPPTVRPPAASADPVAGSGPHEPPAAVGVPEELLFDNGLGGFSADGREYVTVLDADTATPAPWTNVVANDQFGFHATAEGAGYTWWRNSRDNQITPWRNDPVSCPVSEAIYVRDLATGAIASATASPVAGGRHVARHGFGYTRYTHQGEGLDLDQTVFVAPEDPVKLSWVTITNKTGEHRRLSVTAYAELVLGSDRTEASRHLVTDVDELTRAFVARNPSSTQFGDQVVFLDLAGRQESWTGDRLEFLGSQGTAEFPAALAGEGRLSGAVGAALDPCAALQQLVELEPYGHARVLVVLGAGHGLEEVRALVARYRSIDPERLLAEVRGHWERRLGWLQVRSPNASFDLMMNGWLLYQTLACRMLARSGYYQASGAYGFRDQLQDSMAVVLADPQLAREHVLRAAGRQFPEGDVQHWWLPETGQGIRTRISDDVVWLAHAVCRYVEVTGDRTILDEQVPFIEGPDLAPEQREAFFLPTDPGRSASVYDHCVLGLRRAFRYGRHGLPLIGTGDWNDGMNRVGSGGDGESVWLGWFLDATLTDFARLALARGDTPFAASCREQQQALRIALEEHGWDGAWYRRGYFDDGTPLGSASRTECRIDAIAQSWAVLSGAADPTRAAQAMDQLQEQLCLQDPGILRLLTPPFEVSEPDPGYIRAYPPGVRENGGQYTHGALWSVFAWARLGREDRAGATFDMINPINHALSREAVERYKVEPYVVAADVLAEEPHVGRGGWTWYTGSAGWMYRAGLEAILGLRREADALLVEPCLPPEWTRVEVSYGFAGTMYEIEIRAECEGPRQVARILFDGEPVEGNRLLLVDDSRTHSVTVEMESRPQSPGVDGEWAAHAPLTSL